MDLAGRAALVTGGASGIGRATARRLAAESMQVCVVDLDGEGAQVVADEIGGVAIGADVSRANDVDAAFAHCAAALGAVDLAFLNAGVAIGCADISALDDDEYRRIMGVNVDGVVFGTRAAVRAMRGRGGVIMATASLAGIVPFGPDPVYSLTKHAVIGFVRSLAPALETEHIAIHAICPGMTDTGIVNADTKAMLRAADFPLMEPEQIAEAVVRAATSDTTGDCWVCQPGREPIAYRFRDVPGPRTDQARGSVPPGVRDGSPPVDWAG